MQKYWLLPTVLHSAIIITIGGKFCTISHKTGRRKGDYMEINMYKKALQKNRTGMWINTVLGLALCVPPLLFGMFGFLPLMLALGVFLVGFGIVGQVRLTTQQKRMEAYGVDDAAMAKFEAEYAASNILSAAGRPSVWNKDVGKPNAALTQNWLFCRQSMNTALMPLCEVVWYYKHTYEKGGVRNWVMIHFSDGSTFKIFCGDQTIISSTDITATWLGALQKLCPRALAGYSDKRYAAYAKDREDFAEKVRRGITDFES